MIDWLVPLILGFAGGFLGGTIAYHLEAHRLTRERLMKIERKDSDEQ